MDLSESIRVTLNRHRQRNASLIFKSNISLPQAQRGLLLQVVRNVERDDALISVDTEALEQTRPEFGAGT